MIVFGGSGRIKLLKTSKIRLFAAPFCFICIFPPSMPDNPYLIALPAVNFQC